MITKTMDDVDFEGALKKVYSERLFEEDCFSEDSLPWDTIQFALLLAKKVQSGEITENMRRAVNAEAKKHGRLDTSILFGSRITYQAMRRALIEETREEMGNE